MDTAQAEMWDWEEGREANFGFKKKGGKHK